MDGVEISIRHNLAIFRAIHWGARQVSASTVEFDPRADWWRRPRTHRSVCGRGVAWR
ncbi:hypothetical protein DB30_03244 [Enhygromyxa salina]|uniref:Uncharacterized protein n=1 Tax=Enhygromyxa salina TaxID=215803 RepID=A0A0C2A2B8_9BACT|nr:hypothetical protein DB30_03244 [Enhygromyxa salina]